jgi:hypothetical protein
LQEISQQKQKEKRAAANPTKNDRLIATAIRSTTSVNSDGMPSVSSASAHPALVQPSQLILPSVRVMSQTSGGQHKRRAAVSEMAGAIAGEAVPSTRSRNTDSLLEDFSRIQQQDSANKSIKAHAAMVTANGQQIIQHISTLTWLNTLPASPFRAQAMQVAEQAFLAAHVAQSAATTNFQIPRADSPIQNAPSAAEIAVRAFNVEVPRANSPNLNAEAAEPVEANRDDEQPFLSSQGTNHSNRTDDNQDVSSTTECQICQSPVLVGQPEMYTPCRHRFHFLCLGQWLKTNNNCPACRAAFGAVLE